MFSALVCSNTQTRERAPCKEAGVVVSNLLRFRREFIPDLWHRDVSSLPVTSLLQTASLSNLSLNFAEASVEEKSTGSALQVGPDASL